MSFLFPQFLFGLLALAIPVIIHLFNFRKTKRVFFSTTRFLQHVKEASSSKLKLKHLLILCSRLLFLFFLVMAFSQPIIPAEDKDIVQNHVTIYLDNSMSMSNEIDDGITAFEEGISYVQQIVEMYPPSTQYLLLTNEFAAFSSILKSKSEVLELLTEIKLSGVSRSTGEISSRLRNSTHLFNNDVREIYWVSDFQKSTAGNFNILTEDSLGRYEFIPLTFTSINNVFVDSVYLENPFLLSRGSNTLKVKLRNSGTGDVNDLLLKLFFNDSQIATATVDLKANAGEETHFDLGFQLENSFNTGRISFEEYPVTFDNDFFFTINRNDRIRILEIKETSAVTSVERVYGNSEMFDFKSFNTNNLDYSQIGISDLVVINGLQTIDLALSAALLDFSAHNGNTLLIPSATPNIESYASLFARIGIRRVDSALMEPILPPDLRNPFFVSIFENENENFSMPEARPVITWIRDRDALLKFRSGDPFLARYSGSGYFYLMASPLSENYNTIDRHAIFVPVMYKIAASGKRSSNPLFYSLNRTSVTLTLDSLSSDRVAKLTKEELELIPFQVVRGNELIMELPKHSLAAGFYQVVYDGKLKTQIAFNSTGTESILAQYDTEELNSISEEIPNMRIFETENAQSFSAEIKERNLGVPLWKYALILALIFLMVEILLIRFL